MPTDFVWDNPNFTFDFLINIVAITLLIVCVAAAFILAWISGIENRDYFKRLRELDKQLVTHHIKARP